MSCWSVLGLAAGTDARSIKRQYATLLKQHRPDEDPEGFQHLRQAYEQALEWAAAHPPAPQPAPSIANPPDPEPAVPTANSPAAPVDDPRPAAQQLLGPLLEGISAVVLVDRHRQARQRFCEREFEDAILQRCVADPQVMAELAAAALEYFQWQSPWQRIDLPSAATAPVLDHLLHTTERALAERLDAGDADGFMQQAQWLMQSHWLNNPERRQWFSACLARLLQAATFWSSDLFDAITAQQAWKYKATACPEPFWSQLESRRSSSYFLAKQRQLAAQDAQSSAARAARLFFSPLDDEARRLLSIMFTKADWQACEALADKLEKYYPDAVGEVPGSSTAFWRPLRRHLPVWNLPIALGGTGLWIAWADYWRLGSSLTGSLRGTVPITILLAACAWCLRWACQQLGERAWRLDLSLSERFGRWLSARRPAPLLLREYLPSVLLTVPIQLLGGWPALLVYIVSLLVLAGWARGALTQRLRAVVPAWLAGWIRELAVGATIGLLAASVVFVVMFINSFADNQPLYPVTAPHVWPTRQCAALAQGNTPCLMPATRQQWYGAVTVDESKNDQ